jgi:DNA invertase Pin-like site-specific DNA recombinase
MSESQIPAAQYIRMSTDRQDLSPAVQKTVIAAFAAAHGYHVVRTYEDDARSGLTFERRVAFQQLVRDVDHNPEFTTILVYDVSRWGRPQDVDEAAHYEFSCRRHGVGVIYVAQGITDHSLDTAYLKNLLRLEAARYSRDLAIKSRAGQEYVISLGFQMGQLPPFGYRRRSVSADGKSQKLLPNGQRKLALTDRIKWVLGPPREIDLVRRICHAYAHTPLDLWEIARLVTAEGWKTQRGSRVTENSFVCSFAMKP